MDVLKTGQSLNAGLPGKDANRLHWLPTRSQGGAGAAFRLPPHSSRFRTTDTVCVNKPVTEHLKTRVWVPVLMPSAQIVWTL